MTRPKVDKILGPQGKSCRQTLLSCVEQNKKELEARGDGSHLNKPMFTFSGCDSFCGLKILSFCLPLNFSQEPTRIPYFDFLCVTHRLGELDHERANQLNLRKALKQNAPFSICYMILRWC